MEFFPGSRVELAAGEQLTIDEELALAARRVAGLQAEAAAGAFGEPLHFLTARELETIASIGILPVFGSLMLRADSDVQPLPEDRREARMAELRLEAKAYISALEPKNGQEAAKRQAWLAEIDRFSAADLVNFQLYREFSTPTLGDTKPPVDAPYGEMLAYSEAMGWLEFRFGQGILQEGYYDGGDSVCELRLTPCLPSELRDREAKVLLRLYELGRELDVEFVVPYAHLSLGIYAETGETGGAAEAVPVIGLDEAHEERTLDVVSGIGAAIEDAVFMRAGQARHRRTYGAQPAMSQPRITTHRTDVRIHKNYLELRANTKLNAGTDHGLLWMMAAAGVGMQLGRGALAEQGHTVATVGPSLRIEPTATYAKERDIELHRAIEDLRVCPDGQLDVWPSYLSERGMRLTERLTDFTFPNRETPKIFAAIFLHSLSLGEAGQLQFKREVYHLLLTRFQQATPDFDLAALHDDAVVDRLEAYISQDVLRAHVAQTIGVNPAYPGLTPEGRYERWVASPFMRAAYGADTECYAGHLARIAAEAEAVVAEANTLLAAA
ncbi:MAG TPA: hypothetical protein VLF40_05200 [Candidatus Saccharimonadales bacterium]|nr:hypothetical protein [Candidatus Saccharimonadales bacterium]